MTSLGVLQENDALLCISVVLVFDLGARFGLALLGLAAVCMPAREVQEKRSVIYL